jgi:putative transposase
MVVRRRLLLTGPAAVFVTTTVVNWLPVFSDESLAEQVTNEIRETTRRFDISVCAYVLMPSHLHLLIGFPQIESLTTFMQILKQGTARRIKNLLSPDLRKTLTTQSGYYLWKPRFDDLIIETEKQFRIKAEYIHNNPVKAGLVQRVEDYPHSSARYWLCGKLAPLPIDSEWRWSQRGNK